MIGERIISTYDRLNRAVNASPSFGFRCVFGIMIIGPLIQFPWDAIGGLVLHGDVTWYLWFPGEPYTKPLVKKLDEPLIMLAFQNAVLLTAIGTWLAHITPDEDRLETLELIEAPEPDGGEK